MLYELISIGSAIIASMTVAYTVTASYTVCKKLDEAMEKLDKSKKEMQQKVLEFDEITKQASNANMSLGEKVTELDDAVLKIDEKVSMAMGTTGTKKNNWGF